MKKLLLITYDFPYGEEDLCFIGEEFRSLRDKFEVTILVTNPTEDKLCIDLPEQTGVFVLKPDRLEKYRKPLQLLREDARREIREALADTDTSTGKSRRSSVLYYSCRASFIQKTVKELDRKYGFDVIYTYWCTPATLAVIRHKLAEKRSYKIVTRFHGYDVYKERTLDGWQCFRRTITAECDKLVFASRDARKYFVDNWCSEADKTELLYLGSPDFGYREGNLSKKLSVVSCSSLKPLKRVPLIAEAIGIIGKSEQVSWNHFGGGEGFDDLAKKCAKQFGDNPNIRYKLWGTVRNEKIGELYDSVGAEVFVNASTTEGTPISVAEALSKGIPAVGTAVGGNPEIIENDKTGYLISKDPTPDELAEAILKLWRLSDDEKIQMKRSSRAEWERRFNATNNAGHFADMLVELTADA